ncbi:MAG: chemotaxis protein CheW, partial [Gammaproteobacteria bacterium]
AAAAPGAGGNGAAAAFNLAGMDDLLMTHQAVGELGGLLALQTAQPAAAGLCLHCLIPGVAPPPRALMVTAGGYRLALPMQQVDCILRARVSEAGADGRKTIRLDDAHRIPLVDLAVTLGAPDAHSPDAHLPDARSLAAASLSRRDDAHRIPLSDPAVALGVPDAHLPAAVSLPRSGDAHRIPLGDPAATLGAPDAHLPAAASLPRRDDAHRIPLIDPAVTPGAQNASPPAAASLPEPPRPLVLLRMTDRIAAFAVDQVHDIVEVTQRAPGAQLAGIRGIQAIAVPTEGGGIAPVFDPAAFIESAALQDDGLAKFPLGATAATGAPAPTRVLALETPRGAMLIPLDLIADIVGLCVSLPPLPAPAAVPSAPQSGDFARHDFPQRDFTRHDFPQRDSPRRNLIQRHFDWRGLQVPLLDAAAAVGAPPRPLTRGARAVVLRPLQGSRATAFFALASAAPPMLLEVAAHAPAVTPREPPDNALGCVQLQHRIGIIPDLRRLAHGIFAGGVTMHSATMQ